MLVGVRRYKKKMLLLRKRGTTLQVIADTYGVTRERIRQIIGTEFKPLKISFRILEPKLSKIIKLLKQRKHFYEIAKILNVTTGYLSSYVNDYHPELRELKKPQNGKARCYRCRKDLPLNRFSESGITFHYCRICNNNNQRKYQAKLRGGI